MHDQCDVHAVQMEQSKIKNTALRMNPIILEKINQVRCKGTFTAFRPCRNRGRATRVRHLPCPYATISANDARGTESERLEDSLRCSTSTRSSKIPVTVQKLMLKEQKGTPGYPVCRNGPSPQREDSRERVRIGSRGNGARRA